LSETRKALIQFEYSEKIKSELIIASKLFDVLQSLKGEERKGAEKLLISFLNALQGEISIAYNVSGLSGFDDIRLKVQEAALHVRAHEYSEALRRISEAVSLTTTSGEQSAETLKRKGML